MNNLESGTTGPRVADGGSTREVVLDLVAQADTPLTIEQVATRLGRHANTVRVHLEALVASGQLTRQPLEKAGRGRPAWTYAPAPDALPPADYRHLAVVLADAVRATAGDPAEAAQRIGRQWGARMCAHRESPAQPSRDAATGQVIADLERMGFDPERYSHSEIRLRACPLIDAARDNRDVVCGIHQGMLQTIAETAGASGRLTLEPFGAPSACVVHVPA
ncbi:MAG: helix-turn-helix domain-containing protein [Micrococcales bacterium]|nr:helix-turn-helix domain-containing protein [Micrococcales bacterium]